MDAPTAATLHQLADQLAAMGTQLNRDATHAIETTGNYSVKATERSIIALHLVESLGETLAEAARALHRLAGELPNDPHGRAQAGNPRRT